VTVFVVSRPSLGHKLGHNFRAAIQAHSSSGGHAFRGADRNRFELRQAHQTFASSFDFRRWLKADAVAPVRTKRFPSNVIPSGKNRRWNRWHWYE
jgi:hypothetical protein